MSINSTNDLQGLARVGKLVAETLQAMEQQVRPGISTGELDRIAARLLRSQGAQPAPWLHFGFPGASCISLNDEAVHGIPGARLIQAGDLVKLDVTAELDGYIADAALTVAVPPVAPKVHALKLCAQQALRRALKVTRAGQPIHAIGSAIAGEVHRRRFSVLAELCGHGTGRAIWEEPTIPNVYDRHRKDLLTPGLVITIEPIISAGAQRVVKADDGWTLRTADGSLSAHFEHTLVITEHYPLVLTAA